MPDLQFSIEAAEPVPYAVAPILGFQLRVINHHPAETIHSIALRCQIRLEPVHRNYTSDEKKHLYELFGKPEEWSNTLRSMLWTHAELNVPPFCGSVVTDMKVPCTFDVNVAATKYFYGLEDGEIPLSFLFSGTVFYESEAGALQVTQIPWDREAGFRLPLQKWRDLIDLYYPNTAWMCLRRDVFDRLYFYKVKHGIPTWEQLFDEILTREETQ